ncbi:MAG TPA: universal stress protein [Pseudonocardia sp.]|uniref:universal stress protein n=1 Tax=Pseudonocardia sp. TaxID=60912 RepID=UPI002C7A7217|nr:universal stress protein [Pseudonocardia sp.]HTF54926.1 universal stress protein [Pseudonocardia sp.]
MMQHQARRPIVAGVDGSESALVAVRWAAAEACRREVPLRLVNACPWPKHHFGPEALGLDYPHAFVRAAREQLASAADAAIQAAPGIEVQQQVIVSYPVPVLVAESERAQLVVLGDRGLGGVTGLLIGSVAVALAAEGACPVVVVRGEPAVAAESRLPVVLGVDGSPTSEAAIAFAFEAAEARGVPLVALLSWRDDPVDPTISALLGWDTVEDSQRQLLAERLAGWGEKYPDVAVRRVLTRGSPARHLLDEAKQAQLVVVGSRGRGSLTGLLLGSVSHSLLHHAPCPVAIVRPQVAEAADR